MHILRATAQSSMLTQDMIDVIDHILRPSISRNQPYPAAIQIPHMPMRSTRSWPDPSNMLPIHITRLATDGVSGSPGSNMPTRQLISAHSIASNHSPALPPNNSRVVAPKVSTRDWLAPLKRRASYGTRRRMHRETPTSPSFHERRRTIFIIRYRKILQTSGIGNLSRDYSTIRSLSIFVTCGFVLEKNVTYLKELNIASQYRKFVSQRRFQAIEVARFAPIRCSTTHGTTLPPP